MTYPTAGLSVPNLDDGLAGADLRALALVFNTLQLYCWQRAAAKELRLSGRITEAMVVERECEMLYRSLPEDVRW